MKWCKFVRGIKAKRHKTSVEKYLDVVNPEYCILSSVILN
jgi:hypothetical protein